MLRFEPALPEDVPVLFQLNKQLIDDYEDTASLDYGRVLQWVRANLEKTLPCFRRVLYDGNLAGWFCLSPAEGKTELDSLFVLPEYQGRGIGTEILKHCQKSAPVFLYVFCGNVRAIALYERMGFRIAKEVGTTRYIMEYEKQG